MRVLHSGELVLLCADRRLRVRWSAPAARRLLGMDAAPAGAKLNELRPTQAAAGLAEDAAAVLARRMPLQRELETEDGRWLIRRVSPYRAAAGRLAGVLVAFTDITQSRSDAAAAIAWRESVAESLEERVRERTAQIKKLSAALAVAEERERRALAQDLHDDIGQTLAVIKLKVKTLETQPLAPAVRRATAECGALLDAASSKLRSLTFQLSPPILHELGLVAAIEWLADEMRRVYGLEVVVRDDRAPKPLDQAASFTLFRAVRELLINVAKHAHVGAAEVATRCSEAGHLVVTVSDAGSGFHGQVDGAPGAEQGFGLISVRERVGYIGGQVRVRSRPGDGTTVTLTAPLARSGEPAASSLPARPG